MLTFRALSQIEPEYGTTMRFLKPWLSMNAVRDVREADFLYAAWTGNVKVVASLIESGTDIRSNENELTVLDLAIWNMHTGTVQIILDEVCKELRSSVNFKELSSFLEFAWVLVVMNDDVPTTERLIKIMVDTDSSFRLDNDLFDVAALYGSINLLKRAKGSGKRWSQSAFCFSIMRHCLLDMVNDSFDSDSLDFVESPSWISTESSIGSASRVKYLSSLKQEEQESIIEGIWKILEDPWLDALKTISNYFGAGLERDSSDEETDLDEVTDLDVSESDSWFRTVANDLIYTSDATVLCALMDSWLELPPSLKDEELGSLLELTILARNKAAFKTLVSSGEDIEINDELEVAVLTGAEWVFPILTEAGVNITELQDDETPLMHAAAALDHASIITAFHNCGWDVSTKALYGITPIHVAATLGNIDAVKALLSAGADGGMQTEAGETALHAAAILGNVEIIKALREKGVNTTGKNGYGFTASQVAERHGHPQEIVEALK